MEEKILKFKEKVLKTYSLESRHTLKMSKKFRETSSFNLFPQIPESYFEKDGLKSIPQNPGEILRRFSRINKNGLSLCTDISTKIVKIIPKESPHILIK
jgi:hypothetical protein